MLVDVSSKSTYCYMMVHMLAALSVKKANTRDMVHITIQHFGATVMYVQSNLLYFPLCQSTLQ